MREDLLGYLIKAIDDGECQEMEAWIEKHPELKQDASRLDACLNLLKCDHGHLEAPPGLAARCCQSVAQSAAVTVQPTRRFASWRFVDVVVAASVLAVSAVLFFPALLQSRSDARLSHCQSNLQHLHQALVRYAEGRDGLFPEVPAHGNAAVAGIYAVRLADGGQVDTFDHFLCPSSRLAETAQSFRVPTMQEVKSAVGRELREMQRTMGGSYGYVLGHLEKDRYQHTKNRQRPTFALMADALYPDSGRSNSCNHGGCGQNVLFEDGRVVYLTSCKAEGLSDDIFRNEAGLIAAGLHADDSVIAHSAASPNPENACGKKARRSR